MLDSKWNNKYIEIGCLNKEKNWSLIRNRTTDILYLLKRIHRYDVSVFAYLKQHPHPNIAKIEDFIEDNGVLLVIEEYIQGHTLEQLLSTHPSQDEDTVLPIVASVCQALIHLHTLPNPIIHRDVKLANIMIDSHSHVTLVDFDVSRFYKAEMNTDTTILGTEGYAAPEQFGFKQTDARSDIYSLGIVMNYLLTGMHPKEFLYSGSVNKIIQKCINFDPNNRYKSVNDLYQDILKQQRTHTATSPFWLLPGFRTRTIWKMVVGVVGYILLFDIIIEHKNKYITSTMITLDNILFSITMIAILILSTNYMNIQRHLDFFDSPKRYTRFFGYVVYIFIIILLYSCCVLVLATLFEPK